MSERERFERERMTATTDQFYVRERLPTPSVIIERPVLRERFDGGSMKMERVRIKEAKRLTILELEDGKCRFPIGRSETGLNEFLFCGNDVTPVKVGDKPRVYCDWHHAKAHTNGSYVDYYNPPEDAKYASPGLRRKGLPEP